MLTLNLDAIAVQSFHVERWPGQVAALSGANTCFSCNLTDDDFTCMYDPCGSGMPGLTCYRTCTQ